MAYDKFGHDPGRIVAPNWQDYRDRGQIAEARM
jgi:hypothetical protein